MRLALPPSARQILISKAGFLVVTVSVDDAERKPRVLLPRGNLLQITCRGDGPLPPGLSILVPRALEVFEGTWAQPHPLFRATGASSSLADATTAVFPLDSSGRVVLAGLTPGRSFDVELADRAGRILDQRAFSLGAEESGLLHFPLPSGLSSLEGKVLDPEGHGLAGVRVRVGRIPHPFFSTRTDWEGRFAIPGILSPVAVLSLDHPRHMNRVLENVSAERSRVRIQLEPCRTVTVDLRDAAGAAVMPERVVGEFSDGRTRDFRPWKGPPLVLRKVPMGRFVLRITFRGREQRLEVPSSGEVGEDPISLRLDR